MAIDQTIEGPPRFDVKGDSDGEWFCCWLCGETKRVTPDFRVCAKDRWVCGNCLNDGDRLFELAQKLDAEIDALIDKLQAQGN